MAKNKTEARAPLEWLWGKEYKAEPLKGPTVFLGRSPERKVSAPKTQSEEERVAIETELLNARPPDPWGIDSYIHNTRLRPWKAAEHILAADRGVLNSYNKFIVLWSKRTGERPFRVNSRGQRFPVKQGKYVLQQEPNGFEKLWFVPRKEGSWKASANMADRQPVIDPDTGEQMQSEAQKFTSLLQS